MKQSFRSFSNRLTSRIVWAMMVTLIAVSVCIFQISTKVMNLKTQDYYEALMETVNLSVEKVLNGVEVATTNNIVDVEERLATPQAVYGALTDFLQQNPQIAGVFAAFEADYYPEQGRLFEAYAVWRDGRIDTVQLGSASHDYLSQGWYAKACAANGGYWTQPYYDHEGAKAVVCSYSMPIRNSQGREVGIFGADVSLNWLHTQLQQLDLTLNSERLWAGGLAYSIIVDPRRHFHRSS